MQAAAHSEAAEKRSILQRIAAGDGAAVNECIDQYGALIWSLARRYLGNEADAEDAVQEIYIELWSSAARYDPSLAKESTFIATIARRRLIDKLRAMGRRPPLDSLDADDAALMPSVPDGLEDDAELAVVEMALGEMKPSQRDILAMSLYQGYSHSEIAARTAMPLGTVKTNVRRGLMQIRDRLNIAPDDDGS